MIATLVKKDFIIIKKYVLAMVVVAALIPLFVSWQAPEVSGQIAFALSVTFSGILLLQYNSAKEHQYPQATTLLCATPYSRTLLVLSKYVFCFTIYLGCCLIFWVETCLLHSLKGFSLELFVTVLFALSVFVGIYLPVQYRLGYERTKFVFMVVVVAIPFLLPQLSKLGSIGFTPIPSLPQFILCPLLLVASMAILALSTMISISIFRKTELQ